MSEMWRCPEHWDTDIPGSFNNDLCPICVIDRLKVENDELRQLQRITETLHDSTKDEVKELKAHIAESEAELIEAAGMQVHQTDRATKYRDTLEEIAELCGTPDPWQDDYDEIGRIVTEVIKEGE